MLKKLTTKRESRKARVIKERIALQCICYYECIYFCVDTADRSTLLFDIDFSIQY